MTIPSFTVRVMQKEDVPQALNVWKGLGLQEGTQCLYTWLEVDPEAFQIAVTDEGEIIGTCSAVHHLNNLVFVGLYAVQEKYQGLGIGFKIWKACMEHIGDRNACLNSAPEKFEIYRDKGGFPIVETGWKSFVNETNGKETIHPEALSNTIPDGVDIQPFQEALLPYMFQYDLSLMGYKRELAIELNCKEKGSQTLVAMKNDTCVGFGTIKLTCQGFSHVGPLYADDPNVAEVILKRLLTNFPHNQGFSMRTISTNTAANSFIKKIGCPTIEECPRLYRKKKFDVETQKVFAHFDMNFSPY